MKLRHDRRVSLASSAVAGLALGAGTGVPAAVAADGGVDVVNTETVQVYVDSQGHIDSRRVYEQLTMTGTGAVEVANPIEEQGLRNLNGFSGYEVADGIQRMSVDVAGVERLRTVSDFTGDLPLDIAVQYRLDDELIDPEDLVGAEGALEVIYTVKNVTGQQQEITYSDGKGGTITETAEVPIPMVGSLTTTAPASFTEVTSGQANMAGDGQGGTRLTFTMTLFPPLGSDESSFGYTANITDGIVPGASVSALPVNPLESPTFKTAGDSYRAGSTTGAELAAGASEIDTNLLRLRDGASDLLAGLIKLSDGADQLDAGLTGEAAPGARELATGAARLDDGLGRIDDGAGRLAVGATRLSAGTDELDEGAGRIAEGAGRLADGAGEALAGSGRLEDGLRQISGGLETLSGTGGLPQALAGVEELEAGVDKLLAGFGAAEADGTLLNGLRRLEVGLSQLETGSGDLVGGLRVLKGDVPAVSPGLIGAKGGVDAVQSGLAGAVADNGSLAQLVQGLQLVTTTDCGPVCQGIINGQIIPKVNASKGSLSEANQGLLAVSGGLQTAIGALDTRLVPGAVAINEGVGQAKNGVVAATTGAARLKAGTQMVRDGLQQLEVGLTSAVAGVLQLSDGAGRAHAGSGDLSDGLALIDGGAGELAGGAHRLADGTGRLRDGAVQLADGAGRLAGGTDEASDGSGLLAGGAGRLADGLGAAADGSGLLADGLDRAAAGAPEIVDGAGRLSEEGMSRLVEAGEATAQDYGRLYAVIGAGAERADAERMAYGAPEGAQGLTAYSYELMSDDGEGTRNAVRGAAALMLLGLGMGGLALRRRPT